MDTPTNGQQFSLFMFAFGCLAFGVIAVSVFKGLRGLWRASVRSWSLRSLDPLCSTVGKTLKYWGAFLLLPFMATGGRHGRK